MSKENIEKKQTEKKTNDKNITISKEILGEVRISESVIANIAVIAAKETEGVSNIVGDSTNEIMTLVGVKGMQRGVKIKIFNNVVTVDLALIMQYGYNIPVTCKNVQDKVSAAIENMTGLKVDNVNLRIAGMDLESWKEAK